MGWIGCVRCKKFQCDLIAQTCPLIAPAQPILHRVLCSNEMILNAPKHYTTHQNMSLGSKMRRIGCVHCVKSKRDFVARTFSLIVLIHTVLHRVSCSHETITNAPKHNETYENMSLGSNGVDWVRSLRKIPSWLCGTNFRINWTSSPCFASSLMRLRNDPKSTQTLSNAPKHEFTVQWSGLGAFIAKNPDVTLWHVLLH